MAEGYSCKVLTFGKSDGKDYGFPVIRVPHIIQPFKFLFVFWRVLRYAFKADLIYALDTYSYGICSLIVSKVLFKPLIVRFTGDSAWEILFNEGKIDDYLTDFQKTWHGFYPALLKWRRTIILAGADRIITDCGFLKEFVGLIGVSKEKVTVINNPAGQLPSLENFDSAEFKNKFSIKGLVILSMSRLVPWKGIGTLINLMPSVIRKFPGTTLLVAGDGPQEENLKKLVRDLSLEKSVIFLGVVGDKKEKKKFYMISDIVVQNTFYEGMSNTLVEAMSEGKAIITTDAGGNVEFVDEGNGVIVGYDNAEQIEKGIMDLLADSALRTRLGEASRIKSKQYSLEKLVEKNISLINSL